MNITQVSRRIAAGFSTALLVAACFGCSKSEKPKTFASLNEKMQHQASVAMEAIKSETGIALDYSLLSIKFIEFRLDRLAGTVAKTDPAKASSEAESCGAYIGECLRKQHGGDWAEEQADGKPVYLVKTTSGATFTPITWCQERVNGTDKLNVFKKAQKESKAVADKK